MDRYSESNVHIAYDNDIALVYDVPTSTIFRTKVDNARYLSMIQRERKECSTEYIAMKEFMKRHLEGKIESSPSHPDFFETKHLSKLTIIISNACNLRCKYCYAKYGEYDGYENSVMTTEQAILYLRNLINNRFSKIEHVQFFGGEPLLGIKTIETICKEFEILVDRGILNCAPSYSMITNLTIMDENIRSIIFRYNIALTVSIDGPREINDELRVFPNNKGTYDMVYKNMSLCGSMVKAIESTYTKIHEQKSLSPEALKDYISKKFNIPRETTMVVHAMGKGEICFDDYTREASKINYNELDLDSVHILSAIKPKYQSDLLCNAGYTTLALMPNGDLYPCHMYTLNRSFIMGTYDSSKVDAYDNINLLTRSTREKMSCVNKRNQKECSFCWARNTCHICPAVHLVNENYKNVVEESHCRNRKERMGKLLLYIPKKLDSKDK